MKKILLFLLLFLTSCGLNVEDNNYEIIAEIPEASGICYMEKTDSFFVANDEGKIYEIDEKGNILNKKNIGNYDFEGITCDNKKEELYLLLEDSGNLLKINSSNLDIIGSLTLNLSKKDRKKYFNEKSGAEGLAFDGKYFYISTQNKEKKDNLLKFSIYDKDFNKLKLEKTYNIKHNDLSGLTFYNKELYVISDKNDLFFIYELEKEKIKYSENLKKGNWEGITFNKHGEKFLADDIGKIVKYIY